MTRYLLIVVGFTFATCLAGCQNEDSSDSPKTPPVSSKPPDPDHDEDHDHGHGHGDEGPMIELGSTTAGDWTVTASRSEGKLTAGGETAIDCSVEGGAATLSAVRCWIGSKDATGSIKALAEPENAADPSHRHVHVEVPSPLADGSQLWIEIEDSAGAKHVAGFDLKN